MKSFRFRLETLLKAREAQEEFLAVELARRHKKTLDARREEVRLENSARSETEALARLLSSGPSGSEVETRAAYISALKEKIAGLRVEIQKLEKDESTARLSYMDAARKTEILNSLKRRRREEHRRGVLKSEAARADFTASRKRWEETHDSR